MKSKSQNALYAYFKHTYETHLPLALKQDIEALGLGRQVLPKGLLQSPAIFVERKSLEVWALAAIHQYRRTRLVGWPESMPVGLRQYFRNPLCLIALARVSALSKQSGLVLACRVSPKHTHILHITLVDRRGAPKRTWSIWRLSK